MILLNLLFWMEDEYNDLGGAWSLVSSVEAVFFWSWWGWGLEATAVQIRNQMKNDHSLYPQFL